MPLLLFLFFVILPICEIAVFIEAGRTIGIPATIILTLGSAFLGSYLMRLQGTSALKRFMQGAERGELPLEPVIDGMGILTAGVLLATPGFVTDLMGLLLFIPPLRRAFVKAMFMRFIRGAHVHFRVYGDGRSPDGGRSSGPSNSSARGGKLHKSDNVIDADFETVAPPKSKRPDEGKKNGDTSSPWKKD